MQMGKYSWKAVALAAVVAVTLIGTAPMDLGAGVFVGETSEDLGPATLLATGPGQCPNFCDPPHPHCRLISCEPCCWLCGMPLCN